MQWKLIWESFVFSGFVYFVTNTASETRLNLSREMHEAIWWIKTTERATEANTQIYNILTEKKAVRAEQFSASVSLFFEFNRCVSFHILSVFRCTFDVPHSLVGRSVCCRCFFLFIERWMLCFIDMLYMEPQPIKCLRAANVCTTYSGREEKARGKRRYVYK